MGGGELYGVMTSSETAAKKTVSRKVKGFDESSLTPAGGKGAGGNTSCHATCGICEQPIVDSKDQALFCEGKCKQWIHRFCAGVPLSWFATLSASPSTPFHCYSCCYDKYTESVKCLTAEITMLKQEVCVLKDTVGNLNTMSTTSHDTLAAVGVAPERSRSHFSASELGWGVGSRGRGRGMRGRGGRVSLGREGCHHDAQNVSRNKRGPAGTSPTKEKVEGAHIVWGTLSTCSAGAIQNTIKKVCAIDSVQVKRKTKELSNGKVCWWFVLHDDEANLCAIDTMWEQVQLQTSWKLEPCFRFTSHSVQQGPSYEGALLTQATDSSLHAPPSPHVHDATPDVPDVAQSDPSSMPFLATSLQPQDQPVKEQ